MKIKKMADFPLLVIFGAICLCIYLEIYNGDASNVYGPKIVISNYNS